MFSGKPIIGILGGIGSGKSYVAKRFAELGCLVIDSDAQVRAAYQAPEILATLRGWWGDEIFNVDGAVNRSVIARRVFADPAERRRLEGLLHPWVDAERSRLMASAPPGVVAFVWDTPLLAEVGLDAQCDALVFVDAPRDQRIQRVIEQRGWDADELLRREKLQMPLDRKREISDYRLVNAAGAEDLRDQARRILARIVT